MALLLGAGAGAARPPATDAITITMLANLPQKPAFDVLVANFERAYPNIRIDVTYAAGGTALSQLETTELAAGNAPDLLSTSAGCGQPLAVCVLAKSGYLAPMIDKRWVKRSLPLATSMMKYGQGLFAFSPQLTPFGAFTNDDLFARLGLKIPQTFAQLLVVCQKAKAAGTAAVLVPGANATVVSLLITNLAVATLYGKDKHWTGELRAGKATFNGTAGWRQALQEFVDMSSAGCFEPGMAGTTSTDAQFAQGQGLMNVGVTSGKSTIDAANPRFRYSHHPFPGGTDPNATRTLLNVTQAVSVNAHSSARAQAAAQTFVDFVARPKQNALYAQIQGGLTQYQFLKRQIPDFMSDWDPVFEKNRYVMNPYQRWWNAGVLLALQQNQIGLVTGQRSIDDVLEAMDAAWEEGPA